MKLNIKLLAATIALAMGTTGAAVAAPLALKSAKPIVWSEFLGLNTQYMWVTPDQRRAQMVKLKALGLKWNREGIHWDLMEPTEGAYRYTEIDDTVLALKEQNLSSVFYLVGSAPFATSAPSGATNRDQYPPRDPAVFADRLATLAERHPTVNAWQVWNEQNIPPYWRPNEDAVAYSQLLRPSMAALAARAPHAKRVIGGMAYYSQMPVAGGLMLQALAGLGELTPDRVVAYHPYTNNAEGDTAASRDFLSDANYLNTNLRQHGITDIWATEFGWSSYAGPQEMQPIIGEAGQADYTLRRIALMSTMDFDRVFLFSLSDLDARATVRDRSYGLLHEDGTAKPAYTALQRFLALTGPSITPAATPGYTSAPETLISMSWKRADGKTVLIYWANETGVVRFPSKVSVSVNDPLTGARSTVKPSSGAVSLGVKKTIQVAVY